jgi:hypothetical protein
VHGKIEINDIDKEHGIYFITATPDYGYHLNRVYLTDEMNNPHTAFGLGGAVATSTEDSIFSFKTSYQSANLPLVPTLHKTVVRAVFEPNKVEVVEILNNTNGSIDTTRGAVTLTPLAADPSIYRVNITPEPGYRVRKINLSGVSYDYAAKNAINPETQDLITNGQGQVDVALFSDVIYEGDPQKTEPMLRFFASTVDGATLRVWFDANVLTATQGVKGKTEVTGTAPKFEVTATPNNGYRVTRIYLTDSGNPPLEGIGVAGTGLSNRRLESGVELGETYPNDTVKVLMSCVPTFNNVKVVVIFTANNLLLTPDENYTDGAIIMHEVKNADGTILGIVERSGTAPNYTITAKPSHGYRVTEFGLSRGVEPAWGWQSIKDGSTVLDYYPTKTTDISRGFVPMSHESVVKITFTPNIVSKTQNNLNINIAPNGGGKVTFDNTVVPADPSIHLIKVEPFNGYRVIKMELTGGQLGKSETALSMIDPLTKELLETPTSIIYDYDAHITEIISRYFMSNIDAGTGGDNVKVMITFAANKVEKGSEENGTITLVPNTAGTMWTVTATPNLGYRVANRSILLKNGYGLLQPTYETITAMAPTTKTNTYTNTQAPVEIVGFYSTVDMDELNVVFVRNEFILDNSGEKDQLYDSEIMAGNDIKYKYPHGVVEVENIIKSTLNTGDDLVYRIKAIPNSGYRVESMLLSDNASGWANPNSSEAKSSYFTYTYTYGSLELRLAKIVDLTTKITLTVVFTSNKADKGDIIFNGNSSRDVEGGSAYESASLEFGTIDVQWDDVLSRYEVYITPKDGYRVLRVTLSHGQESTISLPALKEILLSNGLTPTVSNLPQRTEGVNLILIPNVEQMLVNVTFAANYVKNAGELTFEYGTMSITADTVNHQGEPFYRINAVPYPGYIVTSISIPDKVEVRPGVFETVPLLTTTYNRIGTHSLTTDTMYGVDDPKYLQGVNAELITTFHNIVVSVVFTKCVISIGGSLSTTVEESDKFSAQIFDSKDRNILKGTAEWISKPDDNFITLWITPTDGYRVRANSIIITYGDDADWIEVASVDGSGNKIGNKGFYEYGLDGSSVQVKFIPKWHNAVVSVEFDANMATKGKLTLNSKKDEDTVKGGTLIFSGEAARQIITVTPNYGYRITKITLIDADGNEIRGFIYDKEKVSNLDGAIFKNDNGEIDYLDLIATTSDKYFTKLPNEIYRDYSYAIKLGVVSFLHGAFVNVEFTPNNVSIASTDETKNEIKLTSMSDWGTVSVTHGVSYGPEIEIVAIPRAGYRFAGWTVYLSNDDGSIKELNWSDFDYIINLGLYGIEFKGDASGKNWLYWITDAQTSPELLASNLGYLEYAQVISFNPQYNNLTVMATFAILTPTIADEDVASPSYPIYNGFEQELLHASRTEEWAYIQYGFWDVALGGVNWETWDSKIPTRKDVVNEQNFTQIDRIYYRATHTTGLYPYRDQLDRERPTSTERHVDDVRVLPLPISYFTAGYPGDYLDEEWKREWLLNELKPELDMTLPNGYEDVGWDSYSLTRIILGMAEWKKATTETPKMIDDLLQNPVVIYSGFQVTGSWYKFYNQGLRFEVSRGWFKAYGNFAGYLIDVDAFEIIDNISITIWQSLKPVAGDYRDELVEGDPAYKTYATTFAAKGQPIVRQEMFANPLYLSAGYYERSRKYVYNFIGWSTTPQVWINKPDIIDRAMLEGQYITDADWGYGSGGYVKENNKQTAVSGINIYYAIYTRALRQYTVTFNYYDSDGGFALFYQNIFYYNDQFNMSTLRDLTPEESDIRVRGYRYIFSTVRGWPTPKDENGEYLDFIVDRDYTFDATAYSYDIYPDFNRGG